MKRKQITSLAIIALLFAGCATVEKGQDQIVVNAERDTRLAADTFDLLVHAEYDQRASLKAINPQLAASVKAGADRIRLNGKQWVKTARSVTQTYKYNRTADNEGALKANLQTALATLSNGVSEAQKYLNQINAATKP